MDAIAPICGSARTSAHNYQLLEGARAALTTAADVRQMPDAELRPIPSSWGHVAGFGANPPDNEFVDAGLTELLTG